MKYSPLNISHIKKFYSNGGEFMFENGDEFKGYYYKKGDYLYDIITNKRLYKLNKDKTFKEFLNLKGIFIYNNIEEVKSYYPTKNLKDCENGIIKRYFVWKRNELHIIKEISEKDFDSLKNNALFNKIFELVNISWIISNNYFECIEKDITAKEYNKIYIIKNLQNNFLKEKLLNDNFYC